MLAERRKREMLSGWLWEVYVRCCNENAREKALARRDEARHWEKQARTISNLLARMSASEHPITR